MNGQSQSRSELTQRCDSRRGERRRRASRSRTRERNTDDKQRRSQQYIARVLGG